jgi:ABC-type multidrug transport system fused ATPase/permease subunit
MNIKKTIIKRYSLAIIASILALSFSLIYPLIFAKLINYLELKKDLSTYVYLYLLSWFLSYGLIHIRELISFKASVYFINLYYKKFYLTLTKNVSHEDIRHGKVYYFFHNIFDCIYELIELTLFDFIPLTLQIIVMSTILGAFYPFKYVLLISCSFLFFLIFVLLRGSKIDRLHMVGEENYYNFGALFQEIVKNLETIYCYQLKNKYYNKFKTICGKTLIHEQKIQIYGETSRLLLVIILFIPLSIVTISIIQDIERNILKIGDLVLLTGYALNVLIPLNSVGQNYKNLKKRYLQFKEIRNFVNYTHHKNHIYHSSQPSTSRENSTHLLELCNISLKLNDTFILSNINLRIQKNTLYLIKGNNGAGKTSLIKIISGFYQPSSGDVFFEGAETSRALLSNNISIAPQNILLFDETILYNITFENETVNYERLDLALKVSCLSELIEKMPQKLYTQIGQDGNKLSGGEKQLLIIARAVYKLAKIYIFDESLSQVDTTRREKVLKNLTKLPNNPAVVVIEHNHVNIENIEAKIVIINLEYGKIDNVTGKS